MREVSFMPLCVRRFGVGHIWVEVFGGNSAGSSMQMVSRRVVRRDMFLELLWFRSIALVARLLYPLLLRPSSSCMDSL